MNTEREQAYWDEWDEAALRRIIQQQRKITEASKKLEMKKLYQVLIICDDLADVPQLHEQATREPYSFLFVHCLKPRNEMFYKRFGERFALEKDADGSGAQLPGPEAVR